jgi:hypothetical protein
MNSKQKLFGITAMIVIMVFALMTCDDGNGNGKNNGNGEPHESTITAFGKTATVTGDASISSADFATAVEKLGDTLSALDADSTLPPTVRLRLTNMMSHDITIVAGNAVPADVGGALKVGAGYLKSNDMPTIGGAIYDLAANGAFAN